MRIEYFKRFYIARNHRDDAAFLLTFEFCRTQRAKRAEYLIAQYRQKFERDKMIAVLFEIAQDTAQYAATDRKSYYPPIR